jgi:sugar lactone lactonase YvrE
MSYVRHVLVSVFTLVLLAAVPLRGGTASRIIPASAPAGARFVVPGSGLDTGTLTISFPTADGTTAAAQIVGRTATTVEGIVPASAVTGNVRLTQNGAAVASFAFSVSAPPAFSRVTTLAASDKAHDLLKSPAGVAVITATGTVVVTDRAHHAVKLISPIGQVTTLAGSGKPGLVDGTGRQAEFKDPGGVAVDEARNLVYVADSGNHVLRRITFDGIVSTVAGSGRPEDVDGVGARAGFKQLAGLAIDANGTLYVADTGNNKIKRVTPEGVVSTLAGIAHGGLADGPLASALFKQPEGIAVSRSGAIYVADTKNNVLRKIENGIVSTLAGTGHGGAVNGSAAVAEFNAPAGIAVDEADTVYVADSGNNTIRSVANGVVSTLAGSPKAGLADGSPSTALFSAPQGIASAGALYVADSGNDALRLLLPAIHVTTLDPDAGPDAGGNEVRIFGMGFIPGATTVAFGSMAARHVVFVSSTEVIATAPPGVGTVDVTVTTPDGHDTLPAAYAYLTPPTVASVTPATGPAAGGTMVTILGTGFLNAGRTRVAFGATNAASVTVLSPNKLVAITPASTAGVSDVTVTTPAGTATLPAAFTFLPPPAIIAFSPASGRSGTVVTISGTGFRAVASENAVRFGAIAAAVVSASTTQLVVTVPRGCRERADQRHDGRRHRRVGCGVSDRLLRRPHDYARSGIGRRRRLAPAHRARRGSRRLDQRRDGAGALEQRRQRRIGECRRPRTRPRRRNHYHHRHARHAGEEHHAHCPCAPAPPARPRHHRTPAEPARHHRLPRRRGFSLHRHSAHPDRRRAWDDQRRTRRGHPRSRDRARRLAASGRTRLHPRPSGAWRDALAHRRHVRSGGERRRRADRGL